MRINPIFGQLHLIHGGGIVSPTREDRALILAAEQITNNVDSFAKIAESLDLVQQVIAQEEDHNLQTMRRLVSKHGEFGVRFGRIL